MAWSRIPVLENDPFVSFFSPFGPSSMRSLQEEMNRLFDGASGEASESGFPAVNVWSNGDGAVVVAELPGVSPDQVELSVVASTLEIKGERRINPPESSLLKATKDVSEKCLRRERGSGAFSRSIELPFAIQTEAVSAEYKNGLLTVTLPRSEADKPKKITIR
jgi:HSP20 family protein